jgi:ubiquinone/menaquinone biosynthesis C-methylase UbiE
MQKDEISSSYDAWSQTYEAVENATRDLAAASLRTKLLDLRGKDVLEIGCGTGLNTKYLAEHSRSVRALDFSAGMLAQARANIAAENVRFAEQDIRLAWAVADSSVDLIVCTLVLEHIEDLSHVFTEARRVLRVGGEFLLYELHPARQLTGGQAQFKNGTEETVLIPAFLHNVSDYVNTAVAAGFNTVRLEDLSDENDRAKNALPRLLCVLCKVY